MAVSKRTRFEVLRRDGHTCQYCGGKAPDVTLQIDHVIPQALGGDDKPSNLVTACRDCNSGKTSVPPDAPLVQSLSAEAAAYALGMVDKMTRFRADIDSVDDYAAEFHERWDTWEIGFGENRRTVDLPADYRMSLFRWMRMGIPATIFDLVVPATMARKNIRSDAKFTYMAGIVWNMVNEREIDYSVTEETAAVYTSREASHFAASEWADGRKQAAGRLYDLDLLREHIDRQKLEPRPGSGQWRPVPALWAIRREGVPNAS